MNYKRGRIREPLDDVENVIEKMFGGIAFMVNDKIWFGVEKESLVVRCDPELTHKLLKRRGG